MNDLRVSDGTAILDQSSWIESATLHARAKLRQPRAVAPENKRVVGRITQAKFYFVSNLESIVDQTIHASRLPARVGIDKMLRIGRVAIGIVAMLRSKGSRVLLRAAKGLSSLTTEAFNDRNRLMPFAKCASTNTIPSARSEGRKSVSEKEHSTNLLAPWQYEGPFSERLIIRRARSAAAVTDQHDSVMPGWLLGSAQRLVYPKHQLPVHAASLLPNLVLMPRVAKPRLCNCVVEAWLR